MKSKLRVNVVSESAFSVKGHGVHTAYFEALAGLGKVSDVSLATNTFGQYDVTHIHTVGLFSLFHLLFAPGVKVVSAHITVESLIGSLVGAQYWRGLAKAYLRWFYNRADAVFAVSEGAGADLAAMGVTRPIHIVPNTIETGRFKTTPEARAKARKTLRVAADKVVVISCGQVQPRKRVDCFIQSARDLPAYQFIWVGGMPFKHLGADYKKMQALMQSDLPNVSFTGVIEGQDIINYYQAADIFFLPSDQETFGIVVVEAAAAGLPSVLRRSEHNATTFGENFVAGDDNSFTQDIKKLAEDKPYYKAMQTKAGAIARRYDSDAGTVAQVEIYRQLIAAKAK